MRGILGRLGVGVLCSTMLAVSPARATTLRAMSTEELVQSSSAIAVAHVISVQPMRHGNRITTLATLEVASPIKGLRQGQRIFVRVPGGVSGDWGQVVEGAPVMHDGDTSIVFLESGGPSTYQVVGLEQGKLDVVRDPSAPDRWLVKRTFTAQRMEPGPDGILQPAPLLPETEPFEAYLDRVRSLVEAHP